MKIRMQKDSTGAGLSHGRWGTAITGPEIDDRGRTAGAFVRTQADRTIMVSYDSDSYKVAVDGQEHEVEGLTQVLTPLLADRVVLEATTLGFVEILLCCKILAAASPRSFDFLYLEPASYSNPKRRQLLHRRDFELSDDVPGYRAIPGATILLDDRRSQHGVFFLGYEERRLSRAFEDFPMIRPALTATVFGVPAFRPGWEMDAFANNIAVVRDQNLRGGVYFCGAENPAAAVRVLEEIRQGLQPSEQMFIAPIGTKPCGIGVAVFLAEHPEVRVLYDHPRRRADRSSAINAWHLFTAEVG